MIGNDGVFTGYACRFNEIAQGHGEIITPGAFTQTIANWKESEIKLKVLFSHDETMPIGIIEDLLEDDVGLWVRGKLTLGTPDADNVKKLIDAGAVDGMSIAFDALSTEKSGDITAITKVDLLEVSIVVFPAIENAQVDHMIELYDAMVLDEKSVHRTKDGYMACMARVARTGIQEYKGSEVGRPDMETVRVYRPENEVFSDKAIKSFAHRPVTFNHPRTPVNARNWKELAVGHTGGDVVRDGEFIRVPLVLMDADVIDRVEKGAKELSMGYSTELKWGSGFTQDGSPYDAIQTAIQGNHLAVVAAARGGPQLRIGDTQTGERPMADRTIVVDGVSVTTNDVSASVIERAFSRATEKVNELSAKLKEAEEDAKKAKATKDSADAEYKTALETKDGEIVVLKKQVADAAVTPEKLQAMVTDRQSVCDKARTILGDKLVVDGRSNADIRKDVVTAKLGDAAKEMSDAAIEGAFSALTAGVKTSDSRSNVRDTANAFSGRTAHNAADAREEAYEAESKRMANAWKTPTAGAQH